MREQGSGTRLATERLFAGHGLAPVTSMELGSNEAIVEALLAGLGVAILYRHSLGIDLDSGPIAVLDVAGFPVESHVNLVYPVGKQLSVVTQAFMEFARTEAQRVLTRPAGSPRQ
jgi:DNA-binding transcriptional LysR family regulator